MAQTVLEVALVTDASRFSQGFKKAESDVKSFSKQVDQASKGSLGNLKSSADMVKTAFAGIGLTVVASKIAAFGRDAVRAFSELEQSVGGTAAVFGDASDAIDEFAENSADAIGLSEAEFRTATTLIGGQLKRMTGDVDLAARQSIELTKVAADLAATYGGTTAEAVEALGSAFRGEADPAERFNLNLKVSAVNAKAVELGLAKSTTAVDENAKAQATLALIMEQSADAQGQFAREADTLAGKQQRLTARFEDFKAEIGAELAPLVVDVMDAISGLGGAMDGVTDAVGGWATAMGPLIDALTLFGDLMEKLPGDVGDLGDAFASTINPFLVPFKVGIHNLNEVLGINADKLEAAEKAERDKTITDKVAADQLAENELRMKAWAAATEDGTDATEDQEEATKKATVAHRTYLEALQESLDPVLGAVNAIGTLRDAQAHLGEVQEDSESTADDLAEAQLAVAEAMLRAQGALDQVDPTSLNNSIRTLADTLGISETAAADLLEQLGLIDGKTVTTTVVTRFLERRDVQSGTGRTFQGGRAAGGPVSAGESYMVGEKGPELFVPNSNGRIVPHGQFGGNSINVTVNNPEPAAATRDIQRELLLAGVGRWAEVN